MYRAAYELAEKLRRATGLLETIAFDLREGPPWRIVMVDQIAGTKSAEEIALNMGGFIEAVGVDAESRLAKSL